MKCLVRIFVLIHSESETKFSRQKLTGTNPGVKSLLWDLKRSKKIYEPAPRLFLRFYTTRGDNGAKRYQENHYSHHVIFFRGCSRDTF